MSEKENALRWDGKRRGHYEVYYLKLNDPKQRVALWLRYTLLIPLKGQEIAELWGFFFDEAEPQKNLSLKNTLPIAEASIQNTPFSFLVDKGELTHLSAKGRLEKNGITLSWDLKWREEGAPIFHFPYQWMYRASFPKTKVLAPHPDIRISGTFAVGDKIFEVRDACGEQAHLWGRDYAHSWVWIHCNAFNYQQDAYFEALSARINFGPLIAPPLTLFILRHEKKIHYFNSPSSLLGNHFKGEIGHVEFGGENSNLKIKGSADAWLAAMHGAIYTSPKGPKRYCHNSKVADLTLIIEDKQQKRAITLTASKTCAIEWVQRTQDPRVRHWI